MIQRMPDLERWSMPHRAVDMRDWEVAYNMALNPIHPDRCRLMDLVDSLLTDAHTASVMESRVLRVVRSKFKLVDAQGAARPDLLPLLETQWFEDFLRYSAEAVFRGHTLIMLDELKRPGELKSIVRIDPRNVLPHAGVVVRRQGETTGYPYREEPLAAYCIEVGRPEELGILAKVAPVVVVKKYAIGSWSDYVHKYGIPARWVKSRSTDKVRIRQLEDLMQNMVSSAYAVLGGDDELQVMQTPGVDAHKVFDELITRMNSEISKRILGQDGTSDNKDASGTYGSLKVLQGVAEDRHQADKSSVRYVINNELLPRLTNLGYPFAGITLHWDELRDLGPMELVDAAAKLGQVFELDPKHFEERTGIKVLGIKRAPGEVSDNPGAGRQAGKKKGDGGAGNELDDDDEDEDGVTASWPSDRIAFCGVCGGQRREVTAEAPIIGADVLEQLVRDLHNGAQWSQPYFEATAQPFIDGMLSSWRHDLAQLTYDLPDHVARAAMEANLFRFSAAKTLAVAVDMNTELRESKGYADFKRRVEESGKLEKYNRAYLEAEYVNAVNTGIQASRWFQLQRDSDALPNGEYWTQQDAQVRPQHQALHGKIWPLSHPVWNTIAPPNGWKCRCTILPTQDGPSEAVLQQQTSDILGGLEASGEMARMRAGGFHRNRAITGQVFDLNKSYREVLGDHAGKPFALNVADSYGANAGDFSLDAIMKRSLPAAPPGASNAEEALRLFRPDDKGLAAFTDNAGRPWTLSKGTVQEHIGGKKYQGEERWRTLHLVEDVLKSPDEIWLTTKGDATQRLAFIKYYEGKPMVVRTSIDMGGREPMRVASWYELTEQKADDVRNGLLVKKMSGR
jgi:SPP1 gp7 family putative phage head morphogenesis protein